MTKSAQTAGKFLLAGYQARVPLLFQPPRRTRARVKARKKTNRATPQTSAAQAYKPNPVWFKPVMFGLMIIGLLWIITFYISEGTLPVAGLGILEHRGRFWHRHRRLPDDHPLAFLTPAATDERPVHRGCRPLR